MRRGGGWITLLYIGYTLARAVAAILPIRMSYWVAERVADLWFAFDSERRANLEHNLRLVPGTPRDKSGLSRLARRVMRNFARVVTEFLYLPKMGFGRPTGDISGVEAFGSDTSGPGVSARDISRLVDVDSFRRVKQAVGDGTAILVTAHIGNWELGAAMASMLGIDLFVVVYDHPDARVARLFRRHRERKGLKIMSVKEAARIMPAVLSSSSVGIVGDRDFTGQGIGATYFGQQVTVPYAYATLAAGRGIRVIPGFCIRQEDGRYRLQPESLPVIEPGPEDDARSIVEQCLRIFEKCVEKYPEQWYFFERVGRQQGPA